MRIGLTEKVEGIRGIEEFADERTMVAWQALKLAVDGASCSKQNFESYAF